MPHWLIKSALQHAISWLPDSHRCNEWFQRRFTGSLELSPGTLASRLEEARTIIEFHRAARSDASLSGARVLELGTGWYPTIPVAMFLCGAQGIWTYDIAPLVDTARVRHMGELFLAAHGKGDLARLLPGFQPARLAALHELLARLDHEPLADALRRVGVELRVRDARQTGLADRSIDLTFSSGVLYHIPRNMLRELFSEFCRVTLPGGVMIHRLRLTDQYASFDKTLSPFNHLRFTSRQWRWLDSPLTPQNRLRLPDYRELLREAGFEVFREENETGALEDLRRVPLAPEFRHHKTEDLLVTHTYLVARKPASGNSAPA